MKLIKSILIFLFVFCNSTLFADKLSHLRSSQKIVTVNSIKAPYYTVQIVALQLPPGEPGFFADFDLIREFVCTDGFVRYTVGEYSTFSEAAQDLNRIKTNGYSDAFVLNTRKIGLKSNDFMPSSNDFIPEAGVNYTVQLAAFRFPVYVSHFKEFDDIKEYYLKDRIYRYCVGEYPGTNALQELNRIKNMGYKDAFLVPINKYKDFRIE